MNWQKVGTKLSRSLSFRMRSLLIASLVATTCITGLKKVGVLQRFELLSYDFLTRLHPSQTRDPRLLIVGITEADIQQYGWPLSDQLVATLLATLQTNNPAVVGLDIYRQPIHPPGRTFLETQLAEENVVVIMNVGNNPETGEVPPPTTVPWERVGFNDLSIDPDGTLRRALLFVNAKSKPYYSFSLRVAIAYLETLPETLPINPALAPNATTANKGSGVFQVDGHTLRIGRHAIPRLQNYSGGYQSIDNRGYQTLMRFRNRHDPAELVSVSQVLSGQVSADRIRDKVVLIGSVAPSLKDEFYTPYSAAQKNQFTLSGVLAHAHIVSQLLDQAEHGYAIYRFLPQWAEVAWLLGWVTAASWLVWKTKSLESLILLTVVSVLSLGAIASLSLAFLIWLPSFEPLLGMFLAGGLVVGQKAIYQSTHDVLTDLPSREIFLISIQQALKTSSQHPVIVAFLDVDRFQIINKSLGHSAGDRVLLHLAERLQKKLGEHAQIARVGGDEFALLFTELPSTMVEGLLDQIRVALSRPVIMGRHRISLSASIGLAITQPKTQHIPEDLLRDAHTAMYRAKALNEFQYQVFSTDMRDEAIARLDLESDLLIALERDEFILFYQPILDLNTEHISGFEALLRWPHLQQGLISPARFIPVLEETGLILNMGEWVIQKACHQLKQWQTEFNQPNLKMSINLSRQQFRQQDLPERIAEIIHDVRVDASKVQLEITESMVMKDAQVSHQLMLRLKDLGIRLAIDDFGTGYSSLSYLHRFPTDTLKIDRSFVSRMEKSSEDFEIVQTIITLGQKLNMDLVAEGITTAYQHELLRESGCQQGQGYYFYKPLAVDEIAALLAAPCKSGS